ASRMSNAHDHWRNLVEMLWTTPLDDAGHDNDNRPAAEVAAEVKAPPVLVTGTPSTAHGTDLARVFDQILAKLTQRSLLVLISDLFDSADSLDRALARLHHKRHDLIVLQTLDHAELTFPFRAATDFVGLENEGRIGLDPAA